MERDVVSDELREVLGLRCRGDEGFLVSSGRDEKRDTRGTTEEANEGTPEGDLVSCRGDAREAEATEGREFKLGGPLVEGLCAGGRGVVVMDDREGVVMDDREGVVENFDDAELLGVPEGFNENLPGESVGNPGRLVGGGRAFGVVDVDSLLDDI